MDAIKAIAGLLKGLLNLAPSLFAWYAGRTKSQAEIERYKKEVRENELDAIKVAKNASERLKRDGDYAKRVRKRFTRR